MFYKNREDCGDCLTVKNKWGLLTGGGEVGFGGY
tara:strand:- start:348 stop:449 length:102 start_codon:yes stop_codon:yes gene_type:complete